MNFAHTGLFIAIIILICMIINCHISNYFYPKANYTKTNFINLATPKGTIPTQYNLISYNAKANKIPCDVAKQANVSCNQILESCATLKQDESLLSDSELAIIYKTAYEQAGLELMNRIINNQNQ